MSDSPRTLTIGFDGGGTGCRAAVGTQTKGILGIAQGGSANSATNPDLTIKNIVSTITAAAGEAGINADVLNQSIAHLGLAGVMTAEDASRVAAALPYETCIVTDDRLTAVTGALGDADGFLISAGTGTFLAAKQAADIRYIGGWGFGLGDQGAGAWLGRNALERVLLCHDGLISHSDLTRHLFAEFSNDPYAISADSTFAEPKVFAAFAPTIVEAAKSGDTHGKAIMTQGAKYFADGLVQLGFQPGDKLCLTGGLGPQYASFLPPEFLEHRVDPKGSALDGAFQLASRAANQVPRKASHEHH